MVWLISGQKNTGTSDRCTAFRYYPGPLLLHAFFSTPERWTVGGQNYPRTSFWRWKNLFLAILLLSLIYVKGKNCHGKPLQFPDFTFRSDSGHRVKVSGEVQKRTEIAQCRMVHKDEMVASASERISGVVPHQSEKTDYKQHKFIVGQACVVLHLSQQLVYGFKASGSVGSNMATKLYQKKVWEQQTWQQEKIFSSTNG